MINESPLSQFQVLSQGLVKPIYSDYAFGNIPNTVHFLLTGERLGALLPDDCFGGSYPKPKKIVLFFVDSFGWHFWQEYRDELEPCVMSRRNSINIDCAKAEERLCTVWQAIGRQEVDRKLSRGDGSNRCRRGRVSLPPRVAFPHLSCNSLGARSMRPSGASPPELR
jgi:hypothetical protein